MKQGENLWKKQFLQLTPNTFDSVDAVLVNSHTRDHCSGQGKRVNEGDFEVLDKCFYSSDLLILESLYQKTLKPSIGVQSQSTPLIMFP